MLYGAIVLCGTLCCMVDIVLCDTSCYMVDTLLCNTLCYMVDIVLCDTLCYMVDRVLCDTLYYMVYIVLCNTMWYMVDRVLCDTLWSMVDMALCDTLCCLVDMVLYDIVWYCGIFRAVEKEDENPLTVHMEITDYLGKGNNSSRSQSLATTLISLLLLNERTWVNFVSLFVYGFLSHSRIFLSYGNITITVEGHQILTYTPHSWPLSSEGSLVCHTYCDMGHSYIMVISEEPWNSQLLLSAWQWSCHFMFKWLRSVATSDQTMEKLVFKRKF